MVLRYELAAVDVVAHVEHVVHAEREDSQFQTLGRNTFENEDRSAAEVEAHTA